MYQGPLKSRIKCRTAKLAERTGREGKEKLDAKGTQ